MEPTGGSAALREVVHDTLTAEFSVQADGRPATYPLTPFYDDDRDVLFVTSAPAFASKVEVARRQPRVSLLLSTGDGSLHVEGRASVHDDDLYHNARYVRRLMEMEPDTHKRRVFRSTQNKMANPVGRLFLDWYGLRILVEIDPVETKAVDVSGDVAVPEWETAEIDPSEAAKHERATLSYVADGAPWTAPVESIEVEGDHAVVAPAEVGPRGPEEGQACCVLLHWHSDDLTSLGQRLVRGRVVEAGDEVVVSVGSTFEMSNEGVLDFLRFVWEGKKATREYFGESGLTGWTW
ncbi:MAG: pyridoxamine 5'-phosphate oxidase family protein [Halobacteriota archaeon]